MDSLYYFEFCVAILSCCLKIKNKKVERFCDVRFNA